MSPKGDVVARKDGYLTGPGGEVYRITNIDPAKRSMDLIPVLGSSYRPFNYNANESKTIKFGDLEKRYESIGMDDHVLTQRRVAAVDSYDGLRHLNQTEIDSHRDTLTQNLRKSYRTMPIETSSGEVKFATGADLEDGDRVLFPGDAGVIDKAIGAIARAHDNEYTDYKYKEPMERLTGKSWYTDIQPKIREMRAMNAPKEGDTKIDNGVEYVLRGGRWHRKEEPAKNTKPANSDLMGFAQKAAEVDNVPIHEPGISEFEETAGRYLKTYEDDREMLAGLLEVVAKRTIFVGHPEESVRRYAAERFVKQYLDSQEPVQAETPSTPPAPKDADPIGTIQAALQALSETDDGARQVDGAGFNKMDTQFGNDLARKPSLTENQARAALKMLQKYKGQLSRAGIELPSPEDMDAAASAPPPAGKPSIPSEIKDAFNKKKGIPHHVVVLGARVDRDVYDRLNSKAKSMGGYYSAFKGPGAVPGFQFTDREAAEKFQDEVSRFEKAATPRFLYRIGEVDYVFRDGALHKYAV